MTAMAPLMNPHWGTTLDEFLGRENILEVAKAEALTRVIAWQLSQEPRGNSGHHQGSAHRAHAHEPPQGGSHLEGQGQHHRRQQ
jgi:hypothetical protein